MSTSSSHGNRDSSWLVLRRGIVIVRRLIRGPATKAALLDAVRSELGHDAYSEAPIAAEHALKHDRASLRRHLGIEILFDRKSGQYRLESMGDVPWLDLDDEGLAAIALTRMTFASGAPESIRVRAFLDQITSLLPADRLQQIPHPVVSIELKDLDERPVALRVQAVLESAILTRRRLGFNYRAGAQDTREPRYHEVEPYEILFREGHYYLECFDLYSRDEQQQQVTQQQHRRFRLQGIQDDDMLRVLPEKLPPGRRPRRSYPVRYRLAPPAVHHGVSRHFTDMRVERQADGSALVEGTTVDPWDAARTLLHYGDSCVVLGGDEVLREMRKIVVAMAKNYEVLAFEDA